MDDNSLATLLIVISAFLHASWNAFLKSFEDRQAAIGVLNIAGALVSLPFLGLVAPPSTEGWLWILVSCIIHFVYQLSIARMMAVADYSLVYPIARGIGPLVVTLVAFSLLSENITSTDMFAILAVTAGAMIAGLASARHGFHDPVKTLLWAGFTGTFIGIYTLIDGSAVKTMHPLTFGLWSNIAIMPFMLGFLYYQNGRAFSARMIRIWPKATVMTLVAYGGFMIALFAFSLGPLAEIAALRELSIIFAAAIGTFILREQMTPTRLLGIGMIAAGAITLKAI